MSAGFYRAPRRGYAVSHVQSKRHVALTLICLIENRGGGASGDLVGPKSSPTCRLRRASGPGSGIPLTLIACPLLRIASAQILCFRIGEHQYTATSDVALEN